MKILLALKLIKRLVKNGEIPSAEIVCYDNHLSTKIIKLFM